MIVTITLTVAGSETGPFNLYSDVDGYTAAFETGVAKASLLAGYTSILVPNGTTIIRVMSDNPPLCTNFIDIPIVPCTTTTTTTTLCPCVEGYGVEVTLAGDISYLLCDGTPQTNTYPLGPNIVGSGECIQRDSLIAAGATFTLDTPGICCSTTTTTTTTAAPCICYFILNETGGSLDYTYTPCGGSPVTNSLGAGQNVQVCSASSPTGFSLTIGPCSFTTLCNSDGECEGCT